MFSSEHQNFGIEETWNLGRVVGGVHVGGEEHLLHTSSIDEISYAEAVIGLASINECPDRCCMVED